MTINNDTLCLTLHHLFNNLNDFNFTAGYRRHDNNGSSDVVTPLTEWIDFNDVIKDVDYPENNGSARQPMMEFVKFYLAGVINPGLCVFGLIGNVFNVVVLSRKQIKATLECSMELAAHTGLIALAVSDMLYCISAFLDAVVDRHVCCFHA